MLSQIAGSFLRLNNISLYIHRIFFIHSFSSGHSGYFHILAVMNNSVMSVGVQISLLNSILIPFVYYPEGAMLDHMVGLFLTFWGTSVFSIVAASIYIPTDNALEIPFLHLLSAFVSYLMMITILTGVNLCLIMVLTCIHWWLVMLSIFSKYLLAF